MSSELQHLPPGIVAYLDALSRRGADPKSLHSDFLAHLDMVSEWLTNMSDYTIDDLETGHFANVRSLLESTRSSAEEVTWGEQLPLLRRDLYPMFAMMDRVNKRREVATLRWTPFFGQKTRESKLVSRPFSPKDSKTTNSSRGCWQCGQVRGSCPSPVVNPQGFPSG